MVLVDVPPLPQRLATPVPRARAQALSLPLLDLAAPESDTCEQDRAWLPVEEHMVMSVQGLFTQTETCHSTSCTRQVGVGIC